MLWHNFIVNWKLSEHNIKIPSDVRRNPKIEDNLTQKERRPHPEWKTDSPKMEDDLNQIEHDLNQHGRQPKMKTTK